jgi:pyrimidine-specific ribonucleoside hydrolase
MLRQAIMTSADSVTLVALAPLTNLALLLNQHPEVQDQLAGIVFVGGWADPEHQDRPEFNVWQDPEAAAAVMTSTVPVTTYSMEVFTQLTTALELAERFREHQHAAVRLAGELLVRRGVRNPNHRRLIGDAGALVYLTDPALFTVRPSPVATNIQVVVDVNAEAAAETFAATLERYR